MASVLQSVKEVLLGLVADDLVHEERIGASKYYWSFPSEHAIKAHGSHTQPSCLSFTRSAACPIYCVSELQPDRVHIPQPQLRRGSMCTQYCCSAYCRLLLCIYQRHSTGCLLRIAVPSDVTHCSP